MNQVIAELIEGFLSGVDFSAVEIKLTKTETRQWVKMRSNPWRFQPQIVLGTWANPNAHPTPGEIRILRIMTGPDQVTRAIARQGAHLYCFPWM